MTDEQKKILVLLDSIERKLDRMPTKAIIWKMNVFIGAMFAMFALAGLLAI